MTTSAQLEQVLGALGDKIELDLAACERIVREIESYSDAVDPDRPVVALVALDVERYYSSIESTFETIARDVDGAVPEGNEWHRKLLDAMCRQGDARPAVVTPASARILAELLRFRHFLRHAYAVELDWAKLKPLAVDMVSVHPVVSEDLNKIKDFVRNCAGATPEGR
ncbi:MAG: hypothetical protein HY897_03725 [Deltaproteobacteria bacterium]|nr:hypothetical protein [Deltaproteobacteria bacterium]